MLAGEVDKATQCAMQLVRLGADPRRKLHLDKAPNHSQARAYRAAGFDGRSALELARMTKRPELVELMEQHLRYTPEERAEVVHCRCGSRLPWKACHGFKGVGQAPHYVPDDDDDDDDDEGVMYRLSPLAPCPCCNTDLTHYECCWKHTASPAYLDDATGEVVHLLPSSGLELFDAFVGPDNVSLPEGTTDKDLVAKYAALLRSDPDALKAGFAHEGPKCRVASWDPIVYAGCLERLEDEDDFFLWTDLHWKVDETELLRRARAWNKALKKYCRDAGLKGDDKAAVVAKHAANPCAPCGRVGCDAFEARPKQFQRCSRCKLVGYCSRACQKLDWAEHRKVCDEML